MKSWKTLTRDYKKLKDRNSRNESDFLKLYGEMKLYEEIELPVGAHLSPRGYGEHKMARESFIFCNLWATCFL